MLLLLNATCLAIDNLPFQAIIEIRSRAATKFVYSNLLLNIVLKARLSKGADDDQALAQAQLVEGDQIEWQMLAFGPRGSNRSSGLMLIVFMVIGTATPTSRPPGPSSNLVLF